MSSASGFTSILNDFRWPRSGDAPFVQSEDWHRNAYVGHEGFGRFVMMMSGYKDAADLLVKQAISVRHLRDKLVYPIVFNYRQFIELSLKYLVATYGHTVDIPPNWNSHKLKDLWDTLSEILERYGHDGSDDAGDQAAAAIVAEFARVDPASFSYRYPVDTKGRPIPLDHEELDLLALADVMNGLDGYFSGCDGWLDSLQSAGP